jgi:hypothetical protein
MEARSTTILSISSCKEGTLDDTAAGCSFLDGLSRALDDASSTAQRMEVKASWGLVKDPMDWAEHVHHDSSTGRRCESSRPGLALGSS